MMTTVEIEALIGAVETTFADRAAGLERWDDPHPPPGRLVADDEYSRLTDPAKWSIVNARADAWIDVLVSTRLATVRRGVSLVWNEDRPGVARPTDLLHPVVAGGMRLAVGRNRIGGIDDTGVVLGVSSVAEAAIAEIALVPDCGCDACDSGSQEAIDLLDEHMVAVVTGELRLLTRRRQEIRLIGGEVRGTRNLGRGARIDRVLKHPRRWSDHRGSSWLVGAPPSGQQ